jgi:SAM-dependent methyltransferase
MSGPILLERNRAAFSHGESRAAHRVHSSKRVWTEAICRWVARRLKSGDLVLDIGGGGGFKASLLCDLVPRLRVVGLDVSATSLAERHEDARLDANVVSGMECTPFRSACLDAVVFFGALHHTAEQLRTLREVARILRPGGLVLLLEPNSLAVRLNGAGMAPANDIEFRFTLPFVLTQLDLAGFDVEEVRTESIASRVLDRFPGGQSYFGRRVAFEIDRLLLGRLPLVRRLGAAMWVAARKPAP